MSRTLKRVTRLERLEQTLLASPSGCTTTELAARLGVHRSTIWRDLLDLQEMRLPVQQIGDRYLLDRKEYLSSIHLSQGESLMLYLAIRHMIRRTTVVPPAMITALEKLTLTLRHPLADHLARSVRTMQADRSLEPDRVKVWDVLIEGWLGQVTVRIEHQKFDSDRLSVYEFQPYLFEPAIFSDGVYVIGHSLSHRALRTFKVERIQRASLTMARFERPDTLDGDTLLRHAWGIWYGEEPVEVRLRFRPPASRRVRETVWHPLQEIEELPGDAVEWRVHVAGTVELIPWIRGWGPDVEVLAPEELRTRIAEDLRRAARVYGAQADE